MIHYLFDIFSPGKVPRHGRRAAQTVILFHVAVAALAIAAAGCGGGGGGGGGGTTCTSHDAKACYGGDVYWYDSCGKKEEVSLACDTNENCINAQCVTVVEYTWNKTFGGAYGDAAADVKQTSDGGYIVAGDTKSSGSGQSDFYIIKLNAAGTREWSKVYGGAGYDVANSVVQTSDGGFAAAGYTYSKGSGLADFWVMKLDSSGGQVWDKTFGGSSADVAEAIIQTSDGGYAVAGYTYSLGAGLADAWVLKLNSSGIQTWQALRGGAGLEGVRDIRQTSDGGYVAAGFTSSTGYGQEDFYVLKLTSAGGVSWEKSFGGTDVDKAETIIQTSDGGYVVAGETASVGNGNSDFWVLKLDSSGAKVWSNTFGGAQYEVAYSVAATPDGGYIVAGYTDSIGAGVEDVYLVKTDSSGAAVWSRTFGGASPDVAYSVIATTDGGCAVAGYTASSGAGQEDANVIKLNSTGQL